MHLSNNQKGYSIGQVLLVVLVLGLIGGVGYYVYQRQSKDSASETVAEVTSVSSAPKTEETKTSDPNEGYFVVKEWGVKFKKDQFTQNPEYVIENDHTMYLTTSQYREKSGGGCKADGSTGYVARGKAGYDYQKDYNGAEGVKTIDKYEVSYTDETTGETITTKSRKAGDYYYIWVGPQAACYNSENKTIVDAVEGYGSEALKTLTYTAEQL